jgi:RNA polymerase sigma factor (sigma-70 family)
LAEEIKLHSNFNPVLKAGAYNPAGTLQGVEIPVLQSFLSEPTTRRLTDSDDSLMRAFAAGDASAFDSLYERHQQALYRFVRRLLGEGGAAQRDEVFQDTWMRVIQARAEWSQQGAQFRTWLFTIAHHRAVDCLRRMGRELSVEALGGNEDSEPFEPEGAAWTHWPAPASTPEDQAFWRAAGQRLADCLEGLPLAQKSAFLLHHQDGLSVAELAQALEVGFETAKTRLRYAMSKLRTCMGAYLEPEFTGGSNGERTP